MQGRRWRSARSVAALVATALAAVACGGEPSTAPPGSDRPTTTVGHSPAGPPPAAIADLTRGISGGGSSFLDAFVQAVNADFNTLAGAERVTYAKSGTADGRRQLGEMALHFAGSDSEPGPEETFRGGPLLIFPTVAAPVTVSYHLDGIDDLRLGPDTIAGIFSARITSWDDPAVAADNPDAALPSKRIVVVHRSDGSGTTANFTRYLTKSAPTRWTLGSDDTIAWPAGTQGAEKNSGVAAVIARTAGSIGYVDLADGIKANLAFASIRNSTGNFVAPTAEGTSSAVAHAVVDGDLTYDPLDAPGAASYPITAPTYLLVYRDQTDPDAAETSRTWLRYLLTTGQRQALGLGYVGLPEPLRRRAYDQVGAIIG